MGIRSFGGLCGIVRGYERLLGVLDGFFLSALEFEGSWQMQTSMFLI